MRHLSVDATEGEQSEVLRRRSLEQLGAVTSSLADDFESETYSIINYRANKPSKAGLYFSIGAG